jgi:acetate kinase
MNKVLVINSGSSSIKFKIFVNEHERVSGIVERIGIPGSFIDYKIGRKEFNYKFNGRVKNHTTALVKVFNQLGDEIDGVTKVGHRVVHGGQDYIKTTLVKKSDLKSLHKYDSIAPLHNPVNLKCVEAAMNILPSAKHYCVFDTAYYNTLPEEAFMYALPYELYEKHNIRRYGFHGVSHKYAAIEAAKKIGKPISKLKIISCHLGSGCSMTATNNGKAVATTMGFTPLEGLMMSTRSGDIDPAIVTYLINGLKYNARQVDEILNKKSGLLGIAGTMDMREILAGAGERVVGYKVKGKFSSDDKKRAKLALDMFIYSIVRYIGQFYVTMGGADVIVFTGGVGERSPVVRQKVLKGIKSLSQMKSLVVSADEELMIAREILK